MSLERQEWGNVDGKAVYRYLLDNGRGLRCLVSNYGITVTHLWVPDRNGVAADVVLGFDSLEDQISKSMYFGCTIGRYGNRIGGGRFMLNGQEYSLATNNQPGGIPCHLHGGIKGFDKKVWDSTPRADGTGVDFTYTSPDGEEGYPGNLSCRLAVVLTDDALRFEYEATADADTVANLTHHGYFNLKGEGEGTILDHSLMLAASHMTPTDVGMIPTGEITPVEGTPFDFRTSHVIGDRVDVDDEQLRFGGGYDHNWVLDKDPEAFGLAGRLAEPVSGRTMEVWTSEPGIQFYCGNFLDGTRAGKSGHPYVHRGGLCLETQHYPDSPNHLNFPTTLIRAGETYRSATEYRFSVS
jgi:aldose 1-epimerase